MGELYEYGLVIEGHLVLAQVTNVQPARLYIDGAVRDTYHPDDSSLWGPYNLLAPRLFPREWRTILSGSMSCADGQEAPIEFQLRSGLSRVHCRILCAGTVVKRWKNRRG